MTWTFFRSGGTRHSGGLRPMSLADNMLWQDVVTREDHFAPFSFCRGIPQGSVQRLLYFKIEFLFTGSKTTRPGHMNAVIYCRCRHPFFPSLTLISGMLFSLIFGLWAQPISPTSTCHVANAARSYKKNKQTCNCVFERAERCSNFTNLYFTLLDQEQSPWWPNPVKTNQSWGHWEPWF